MLSGRPGVVTAAAVAAAPADVAASVAAAAAAVAATVSAAAAAMNCHSLLRH